MSGRRKRDEQKLRFVADPTRRIREKKLSALFVHASSSL